MRSRLRMIVFAALVASCARAADREAVLEKAHAAERVFDPRKALGFYLEADRMAPNDPVVLQKIARQYSDVAEGCSDMDERRHTLETALDYAERAVALQPNSAVNVLSLAICHGRLAACSDTRGKIAYSRMVKEEAERAMALDPSYGWADHVLGCWNYEVASLNGAERLVARVFYGGLPPASYDEAIRLLTRSAELDPSDPAHRVELGFAYRASGQAERARLEFQRGLAMPCIENFDKEAQDRARAALAMN